MSLPESFERLGAVPEVSWRPRAAADERFIGAHPVPRAAEDTYEGGPRLRWIDARGAPLADEWLSRDSPAQLVTERYYEVPPPEQLELALGALEVPGTRADYGEALGHAEQAAQRLDPPDFALLEELLWAHVSLVMGDPAEAIGARVPLDRAGEPVAALAGLYQREGFLREAADVEALLGQLPPEARPRYLVDPRPQAVMDALRELG